MLTTRTTSLPLYPILTTALSVAGGLLGYKFAVSSDLLGLGDYLLALAAGLALQVPISAVAAHRRDRLAQTRRPGAAVNLRIAFSVHLAAGLAGVAAMACALLQSPMWGYLALVLAALALQYTTYGHASWQQARDATRFWRVQAFGALARVAAVIVLVIALDFAYAGILLSNLAAATAVCWAYRRAPWAGKVGPVRLLRALRQGGARLLTVDGTLRAAKASFEALAINLGALVAERWAGLPPAAEQAVLASVGYLNALAVGLRQAGSGWESGANARPARGVVALGLGATGAGAVVAQATWAVFDPLLPQLEAAARLHIVAACAAYLMAYPATRGYLFVDFESPASVRGFARRVVVIYPLLMLSVVVVLRLVGETAASLAAAATPLALALAMRGRRA